MRRAIILTMLLAAAARAEAPSDRDLMPVELEDPPPLQLDPPPPPSDVWTPPTTFDKVSLVAAETLIVADMLMTINAFRNPFRSPMGDLNPLIGNDPSTGRIVGVCLGGAVLTAALWYGLPDPYRKWFTLTIVGIEAANDASMYAAGIRFSLP